MTVTIRIALPISLPQHPTDGPGPEVCSDTTNQLLDTWAARLLAQDANTIRKVLADYINYYQLDLIEGSQDILSTLHSPRDVVGYILATKPLLGHGGLMQFLISTGIRDTP